MLRDYKFKVQITEIKGQPFLKVKPVIRKHGNKIISIYPIKFSGLNIPIQVRTPQSYIEIGWVPDYFLDFENAFEEKSGPYSFFGKPHQMNILSILEEQVNSEIVGFLEGNQSLLEKERVFKFLADDGLGSPIVGRGGKPKEQRKYGSAKKGKCLSK